MIRRRHISKERLGSKQEDTKQNAESTFPVSKLKEDCAQIGSKFVQKSTPKPQSSVFAFSYHFGDKVCCWEIAADLQQKSRRACSVAGITANLPRICCQIAVYSSRLLLQNCSNCPTVLLYIWR